MELISFPWKTNFYKNGSQAKKFENIFVNVYETCSLTKFDESDPDAFFSMIQ